MLIIRNLNLISVQSWTYLHCISTLHFYSTFHYFTLQSNTMKRYDDMIDHRSYTQLVVKLKPEKNSGLNVIRTHALCDTGAVLYRLSYQAN